MPPGSAPARDVQTPFDVAVVVPTTLRPSLARAVESVFAQDLRGRVQILVGIDIRDGDSNLLPALARRCPANMLLTVLDLPYSTSVRHGGLYPNRFSGALRTTLSFMANSRLVAYLDDDNWFATDHLSDLVAAIEGHYWAFSSRIFAEPVTGEPICIDDWESVGPGEGVFKEAFGGFVDPSSLILDKMVCRDVLPFWSLSPFEDGTGEDRLVFSALSERFPPGRTGRATSYYTINPRDPNHPVRLQKMRERGVVLPADRRAGVRPLDLALRDLPRRSEPPSRPVGPNLLIEKLMEHLRPTEAVVFDGSGDLAVLLDELARQGGHSLTTALVHERDLAGADLLARRVGRAAVVLPRSLGDHAAWLASEHVHADLVAVAGPASSATLERAWRLVRDGGLLLADGPDAALFEGFAAASGGKLLPAEIDGKSYWVVQKT